MIHPSPYPDVEIPEVDVTSYVFSRADERAGEVALIDGPSGRELTWAQLHSSIKGLAAGLAARGIGKGDVIALHMPNLPEFAIAFHGVCSAGATNTTINPLYTAGEVGHQLSDAGAMMLITVPAVLEVAREAAEHAGVTEIVVIGEADPGEAEGTIPFTDLIDLDGAPPDLSIDPKTDVAVLPYSSGTTGLPKGVMLSHYNLVANLCQSAEVTGLKDGDVALAVLPFFHIYGMVVLLNHGLAMNTKLVTMPRFDLDQFLDLIEQHKVTRLWVVPPVALALAKHPAIEGRDLSSIDVVVSGAAPLGGALQSAVTNRLGCVVVQGYGMTEMSPLTHTNPIEPEKVKPGTIGVAVPNVESRLVDVDSGEDAKPGEPGELWMRGPNMMLGYLNNDEATNETIDSDGWLHSGDIATVDSDGYFEIVDRLKELIKFKGFQVAPAELEALIITHPQVSDVAVIGVPDEEAGELPKAYVVCDDELTDEELMAFVSEKVSPQKRIRLIERIDEIPKSASGKILRRVLKDKEKAEAS